MKILAINHITINVKDLEKTKAFFADVFKLPEAGFVDMGDHTLTYYQLTPDTRLELINYLTEQKTADITETDLCTYRHFCLETDNLEGFAADCRAAGVPIRKEPGWVENLQCSTMLITDPNGVEIEIIQK